MSRIQVRDGFLVLMAALWCADESGVLPIFLLAAAAGAFVQGASIELSADAPMREPYVCYMQGGLTYESGKLGILLAADKITRAKAQ